MAAWSSKRDMKTVLTETFIKNIVLVDDGEYAPGRTRFWHDLQDFMSRQLIAFIQFDEKPKNAEAYFQRQSLQVDRIYMPENSAEIKLEGSDAETKGTIRFVDDHSFALFLHEASHYLHLIKDHGNFMAPTIKDRPKKLMTKTGAHHRDFTVDFEYEAGYRSLKYARLYNMFPENDRTVLDLNLVNMLNYLTILNSNDFEGCDPEVWKRRVKEWPKTIRSFDEISDYMTVV